jgi:hypothetical protein
MAMALIVFCALPLALNPPGEASGKPKDAAEHVNKIIAALETRQAKRDPVSLHYTLTEYRSAALDAAFKKGRDPGNAPAREGLTITRTYHIALKDKRFLLSSPGPFGRSRLDARNERPSFWLFDGKLGYERRKGQLIISAEPPKAMPLSPWDVTGEKLSLTSLKEAQAAAPDGANSPFIGVYDVQEPNAKPLCRVEVIWPGVLKTNIWLQPDLDYAVVKLERILPSGRVSLRCDECVYERAGGQAHPRGAVKTLFDGTTGAVLMRVTLRVQSMETDPERIPDSLFKISE